MRIARYHFFIIFVFMIITTIRNDADAKVYSTAIYPTEHLVAIDLCINDSKNEYLGYISFRYKEPNNISIGHCESISFGHKTTFVIIDNQKTFVINKKDDVKELYQYLTNTDLKLLEKQLRTLEKKHNLGKDFK